MTSLTTFAKTNFNDLIVENTKAQIELHKKVKAAVSDVKVAVREEGSKTISVAGSNTINVKSDKNAFTFSKEKRHYKASDAKAESRLAEELQNLE